MTVQPIIREFAPTTVVVSRVERFYRYPDKIFPVSCTNVITHDTYFDDDLDESGNPLFNFYETIAGSRVYLSKVLKGNAGCVVNLSRIRPKGTPGSNGMTSAGVANFMPIYSATNLEIRRGSAFRNGAVVLQLDADHPDLEDFLSIPKSSIPWAKRGVTVRPGWLDKPYYHLIEKALAKGEIFLYKQMYNRAGEELEINVCQGVQFKPRSTCTLAHVNLGLVKTYNDLIQAFVDGAIDLDTIWQDFYSAWKGDIGDSLKRSGSHFIDPSTDKQVGLGVVGLANMLVNFGVSYEDFAEALDVMTKQEENGAEFLAIDDPSTAHLVPAAQQLVKALIVGYQRAATFFYMRGYERAFTIEPTATCAYKQKDYNGFVTSPEISPPIAHPGTHIARRSTDDGFIDYQYPNNLELAGHDVPWQVYDKLCCAWQRLMNNTGLAHSISYNWWMSKPVNRDTLSEWDKSLLKTVYYRWQELSDVGDKTNIGISVDNESEEFWTFDEEDEPPVICQLNSPGCQSCGG
jgi:hypothetical protein